jgi:hypothetical protein
MDGTQSILPQYDVWSAPLPSQRQQPIVGSGAMGAYATSVMSPVAAAARGRLSGLGQDAPVSAAAPPKIPFAVAALVVGVAGYLSYQVGKAIAPSGSKESTWGWIAVPAGLFTGPIGLGIMAVVANQKGR